MEVFNTDKELVEKARELSKTESMIYTDKNGLKHVLVGTNLAYTDELHAAAFNAVVGVCRLLGIPAKDIDLSETANEVGGSILEAIVKNSGIDIVEGFEEY